MMAAAEARAAWQKTSNRYFVQEDAKRAPKFTCCQSSSSTSKQVNAGPTNTDDGQDHPALGFMPLNRNLSFSNLPHDTRWWLQLHSSYGYQKGLTYEQLSDLEARVDSMRVDTVKSTTKFDEVHPLKGDNIHFDDQDNCDSSLDMKCSLSAICMNKAPEVGEQEVKALCSKNPEKCLELMGMDPFSCPVSKLPNEFCLDPESPWIGGDKPEPWWRITDKDELVSLVLKKSHNHIENCDLPPPQKMYVRTHPYAHLGCLDRDEAIASSFGREARTGGIPNRSHAQGCPGSGKPHGYQGASSEEGCSQYGSDKSFSSYSRNHKDTQVSESDHGKAQLMEALCRSQTRARESETIAKQIYAEKEHIHKLFFRQAAQLFVYKQWFQLLLLETLYIQIEKNEGSVSTLFPMFLPWMPYKGQKQRKSRLRATKGRRVEDRRARHDIAKYAVAFALGLSIVSAGLLVGWTLGWMLPPF
ncbi:uncharacterized protein LOC108986397 isoform X1 [Juglans regia]|uniref:Uncharacterized protein LOC108986397 isoform X1 n=1 Tax=Juglans regia TaxID=51240 RepID=A0A6P9E5K3_JUGRE|nr:uncharacterized protein LOC108986397 isoform X1 [Juglans regia]XP_035542676.1 uncharacterized protein LOC108986397 isoform X1 [Juglans regia]